jgi:hypothetical protein
MSRTWALLALATVLCVPVPSAGGEGAPASWRNLDEMVNELARRSGVTVDQLRVDPAALALENAESGTLRLERYLMTEPRRAPGTVDALTDSLLGARGVASRLDILARLGWERPAVPRPLDIESVKLPGDTAANPVEAAMKRLYAGTGKRFQGKDRAQVRDDSRRFPPVLAVQVGALIDAVANAYRMRESVVKSSALKQGGPFEGKSKKTAGLLRDFLNRWWEPGLDTDVKTARLVYAIETVDLDALFRGALPLAATLDAAADSLARLPALGAFQCDWPTPLGRIAVGGSGNDVYSGPYSLVVDLGGNDEYRGPGGASGVDGVSIVLDLGGDDRYAARDSALAGPGGAVLGYAGILDAGAGSDHYEATSWAGGFGFLGVGWIDDRGGNDTYRMQCLSEGSALFGLGLLLDEAGDDHYNLEVLNDDFTFGQSQGFGGPEGCGVLIDLGGKDAFSAEDTSPSPEAPRGFVQGASRGGGNRWAGGFGMLLDGGGDDTYRAGLHAQGSGMGSGLGLLADRSGDDTYEAVGQCQGWGEHLGVGILFDEEGRDRYQAEWGAMGSGEDLGLGMLLEMSGDDVYRIEGTPPEGAAPSVASAYRQGAGWLLDLEGNDTYPELRGRVLPGSTTPWRSPVPGVSVLIDGGQTSANGGSYVPCQGEGPGVGGMLILASPNASPGGTP